MDIAESSMVMLQRDATSLAAHQTEIHRIMVLAADQPTVDCEFGCDESMSPLARLRATKKNHQSHGSPTTVSEVDVFSYDELVRGQKNFYQVSQFSLVKKGSGRYKNKVQSSTRRGGKEALVASRVNFNSEEEKMGFDSFEVSVAASQKELKKEYRLNRFQKQEKLDNLSNISSKVSGLERNKAVKRDKHFVMQTNNAMTKASSFQTVRDAQKKEEYDDSTGLQVKDTEISVNYASGAFPGDERHCSLPSKEDDDRTIDMDDYYVVKKEVQPKRVKFSLQTSEIFLISPTGASNFLDDYDDDESNWMDDEELLLGCRKGCNNGMDILDQIAEKVKKFLQKHHLYLMSCLRPRTENRR